MAGEHQDQSLLLVALLDALALHLLASFHALSVAGIVLLGSKFSSHAQFRCRLVEIAVAHGEGASMLGRAAVSRCRACPASNSCFTAVKPSFCS